MNIRTVVPVRQRRAINLSLLSAIILDANLTVDQFLSLL
jgi:hypothetical protein